MNITEVRRGLFSLRKWMFRFVLLTYFVFPTVALPDNVWLKRESLRTCCRQTVTNISLVDLSDLADMIVFNTSHLNISHIAKALCNRRQCLQLQSAMQTYSMKQLLCKSLPSLWSRMSPCMTKTLDVILKCRCQVWVLWSDCQITLLCVLF